MIKRTLFLSILAALALPAAALAKQHDVTGPVKVAGKGPLRAELTAADASSAEPVLVAGLAGVVRFVDLSGDLEVKCQGKGKTVTKQDDEGHSVVVCRGRGVRATAQGGHFRLAALLGRYRASIPAGYTGTLKGRFRVCAEGEGCAPAAKERGAGRRGEDGGAAKERGAGRAAGENAAPQE
jgi:hypothetical protein